MEKKEQIKKEEEITEKWICPNCKCKTNLVTNPICTICNLKNDDLNEINYSNNHVTIFINKTKGNNKKEDIKQILKEQEKNDNTKNIKIENNKNIKKEEEILTLTKKESRDDTDIIMKSSFNITKKKNKIKKEIILIIY